MSLAAFTPVSGQTPPGISSQPADQVVDTGTTATFRVTASGTAPLTYQWRFNDANLAGRTGNSLVLSNVQSANLGSYTVVVTNALDSVTSRTALLSLPTVHRLEGMTTNPDQTISLSLAGVVPSVFAAYYDIYPIEASTNLVDWSPLAMLQRTNASPDELNYLDSAAMNFDRRFYRTPPNLLITPFPKPSGPYPVGTVSRLVTDPSRTNRYNIPGNSSFMVTFWYPAEARAGVLPEAYVETALTQVAPFWWRNPATGSFPVQPAQVARFVSHALSGLPLATNRSSYPVVIYSHGSVGHRRQNTDAVLELASHGYVVVGVEHMDALASVFPDGQLVFGTSNGSLTRSYLQPFFDNRIKDMLFVLDELSRLNTNDSLWAGRLDLDRLGAVGKSLGGGTVGEFCRLDSRCKAAVLSDAGFTPELSINLTQLGLQKPFLSMSSTMGRPPNTIRL